ncbi:MAG: epoxide hydrolase [Pseudomonadota bacterium]|nr:epoxide hydrolase [Pseudomonadota bacterium]MEC9392485.1 epoxide hydrolase [Pseudomonadota bacterium]MEC9458356.1 epoxide hydrolase [Pseudomonadota bacterium]MED5436972.1 epoxide hydrolase [Pseudomonadota bacterium]
MSEINPFMIQISNDDLEDLKRRLLSTRWPEKETVEDWSQGIPLSYIKEISDYWINEYDWRSREEYYNSFPQFITNIEGLDIHFIHIKSPHEEAKPLIISHGWPGSIVEFHKVIKPLIDPVSFGGKAEDAFHLVCPTLPGYGFSGKPSQTGTGVERIAELWDILMNKIGYSKYFAQGGDWGSAITIAIGKQNKGSCQGIHVNMPFAPPTKEALENPSERDKIAFEGLGYYQEWGSGYSKQQSTRPQTLGYGLVDSPIGQASWIIEKFYEWTDCNGHPENILNKEELIDNVMFYWLTKSATSSARLYWESFGSFGGNPEEKLELPIGCSIFPKEISRTPRSWAEQIYSNIVYWNELKKGGHFAAFEQPEIFVNEIRNCFKEMR